ALARTGFSLDEHRWQAVLEPAFGRKNGVELRTHRGEAFAEKEPVYFARQLRGTMLVAPRSDSRGPATEERQRQFFRFKRLCQVVARAQTNGLDSLSYA